MTNEERIERFRNEKIAVNCETEEEARKFIEWCYENGFEWDISEPGVTHFYYYKDKTCYTFNFCDCEHLGYSFKQFYEKKGYEIIKYKDFMGIKRMTNLEHFVSKGLIRNGNTLCYAAHICKHGVDCREKEYGCSECEFNDVDLCVQALIQEYKEPIKIKLAQWEYDFLNTLRKYHATTFMSDKFNEYLCDDMKQKGHFKGVHDKTMTLQEILDNCEVVEDE